MAPNGPKCRTSLCYCRVLRAAFRGGDRLVSFCETERGILSSMRREAPLRIQAYGDLAESSFITLSPWRPITYSFLFDTNIKFARTPSHRCVRILVIPHIGRFSLFLSLSTHFLSTAGSCCWLPRAAPLPSSYCTSNGHCTRARFRPQARRGR